jgi:hypothetical protein
LPLPLLDGLREAVDTRREVNPRFLDLFVAFAAALAHLVAHFQQSAVLPALPVLEEVEAPILLRVRNLNLPQSLAWNDVL